MNGEGITIVGASAGSGKTYRLTEEVTRAVSAGATERVDLAGLVAVTFTKKAHTELEARIRQKLVAEQAYDEALRMPLAYLGTVHAAALRLLQEFAIDAGLSPNVDVVVGNETKLLRQAFERTMDDEARARLDDLAARLELRIDHRTRRTDWVTPVADIMDLARSNRIAPDDLRGMAERSAARLLALLPPPMTDASALEDALARELDGAVKALLSANDDTRKTAQALLLVREATRHLADGELRWSDWAKLSAIDPSRKCDAYVEALRAVAARYGEHPRLHDELRRTTLAIFDAARAGLVAYQEWKKERRVVDYVDMLDGALDLLEDARVRAELARRLQLVVVDEFQDTSPIQLALFVRLHALSGRSVWVGDRKQCIFEFAGADPVLMDGVAAWVARSGGLRDRLEVNRRSRFELVGACSELFATALARHGFSRDEVVVKAHRPEREPEGLAELPPFGVWVLDVTSAADDAEAIAEGVRRTLDAPHTTRVVDRATGEVRPVQPGDIAVLAATNEWAGKLARALHARGVRAAIARAGLFETPEGTLADAALKWLVDAHDSLAAATIDALTGWGGADPDAWLAQRIRTVATRGLVDESGGAAATSDGTAAPSGWRASLEAVRAQLAILSPAEAVDATLAALDAVHLCARWPDPAQRIANLDALRAVAASYEARCAQEREAATVAGLLRYCDALRAPTLQRDEMLPSDDQHVPADDGAVVVCTYHKAKGLEWPVVVLASLDRGERRNAFDVAPESLDEAFDPEHPLVNRSIRYWPWPLGATKKAPLADAAARSAEGRLVATREEKERARLLYVGFTRARDHLVFAVRVARGQVKTTWLDALCDAEEAPLVELPTSAADGAVAETLLRVGDDGAEELRVRTRVLHVGAARSEQRDDAPAPRWFARPKLSASPEAAARPAYRIAPSAGATDWPELTDLVARSHIGEIERLPSALSLENDGIPYDDDILGNAVHAFFAADVEGLTPDERLARAKQLVDGWSLAGVLRPESLVTAGDTLRAWVARRWPAAVWHREIPIEGTVASAYGERQVSGIIDLLLETPTGYVIIDHKTFPAPTETALRVKCSAFRSQIAAYALLLCAGNASTLHGACLHFPLSGAVAHMRCPPVSTWHGR
jgi:ATP-dependent exoDNAse (exonuclease V) beta subunit